jgi:hypothetical protein
MNKLYLLSFFLLLNGATILAQETTTPVLNKSNRIILHFKDTTGLFTQLARLLIDRGYDIDMKDRELGILRTKPTPLRGGSSWSDQVEILSIFRDSTITFSGIIYSAAISQDFVRYENKYEVSYSKKWFTNIIMLSWEEMSAIAALLKPASISYLPVDVTKKAPPIPPYQQYRRNN